MLLEAVASVCLGGRLLRLFESMGMTLRIIMLGSDRLGVDTVSDS